MRPLASVAGHALHAVHAALVLQLAVDAASLDRGDDFLQAADAGVAARHHLDPPALALGELAGTSGTARRRRAPLRRRRCRRGSRARRSSRRSDPSGRAGPSARRPSASRRATSDLSSSCASSRMSASRAAASSSVWAMSRVTVLYSRNRSTSRLDLRRAPSRASGTRPDRSAPRPSRAAAAGPRIAVRWRPAYRTYRSHSRGLRRRTSCGSRRLRRAACRVERRLRTSKDAHVTSPTLHPPTPAAGTRSRRRRRRAGPSARSRR